VKVALIPPVSLLGYTAQTDMQLMLPHLVDNKQYAYTYMTHGKDPHQHLILDNGVAEGFIPDAAALMDIGDRFMVNEIVLPDVIADYGKTLLASANFLDLAKTHYKGRILSKPKFMFVLQGKTFEEIMNAARWASKHVMVDTLGVPRHLIATLGVGTGIRSTIAASIQEFTDKPIHLLGGSPFAPAEIGVFPWPSNVRSHDTSSPFNYAWKGRRLIEGIEATRPGKYFDKHGSAFNEDIVNENVQQLLVWAGYDV